MVRGQGGFKARSVSSGIANAKFFAVAKAHAVVANNEGLLAILDLEKRTRVGQLAEKTIHNISISPDGGTLAVSCNKGELVIWNLERNEMTARHKFDSPRTKIAIAPGGERVLSAGYKFAELRDLKADRVVFKEQVAVSTYVAAACFSQDGKHCAVVPSTGAIRIWDAASGKMLHPTGFMDAITKLHFLPDGHLLVASKDELTSRRDISKGQEKERFPSAQHGVADWLFTKDGRRFYYFGGADASIRVCELKTREAKPILAEEQNSLPISALAISASEKTIAFAKILDKGKIYFAELGADLKPTVLETQIQGLFEPPVDAMVFLSENTLLARSSDKVRIWDLKNRTLARQFEVFAAPTTQPVRKAATAFTPDRKFLVTYGSPIRFGARPRAKGGQVIGFWNIETGNQEKSVPIDEVRCTAIAMSSDGKIVFIGDQDGAVHAWDVESSKRVLHQPGAHCGAVTAITIASDGRTFATGSTDTTVLLWKMPGGRK
jgi:WD40 repeat protein